MDHKSRSLCALCGQSEPSVNSPSPQPLSVADEAALIQQDIERLDSLICQLNTKRVGLLRRLNDMRSATRTLPPEVLSTIFQNVLSSDKFTHSSPPKRIQDFSRLDAPLVLAAVSSYWRVTATSTPQLWTRIAAEVHSSTFQRTVALMRLYLQNSKELPVSLALFVRCTDENSGQRNELMSQLGAYLDPVSRLVFIENPDRIKCLYLDKAPIEWLPFLTDDFEQLEDLHLGWSRIPIGWRGNYDEIQLMDIPSLRRVTIRNLHWNIHISWTTLSVLDLYNIPIEISVSLLLSCRRHIIEFHLRDPGPANLFDVAPRPESDIVIFPNLKVFGWSFTDSGDHDMSLFRTMQMSMLEKLCFYNGHPFWRSELTTGFVSFLSRLPTTLTILELVNLTGTEVFLDELFGSGINPHTLGIIIDGLPGTAMFLSTIFNALQTSQWPHSAKYLPNLQNIYIKGVSGRPGIFDKVYPDDYPHYEERLAGEFLQMMEERWDGDNMLFCLELTNVWRSTSWTPPVRERLRAMMDSGVQLQIIENSRPVGWL